MRIHGGVAALLLVMPMLATAQAVPPVRDEVALRAAMLTEQNAARIQVGVPALFWSDALAADAAAYAAVLARTGTFRHAVQPMNAHREGENLWMGSRGVYSYADMAGTWIAEGRNFVNAPTPGFSRTGRWQDVGHYTQIVWRGTTAVGCGMASNATEDYLVCRYGPPGNVMGQAAF